MLKGKKLLFVLNTLDTMYKKSTCDTPTDPNITVFGNALYFSIYTLTSYAFLSTSLYENT